MTTKLSESLRELLLSLDAQLKPSQAAFDNLRKCITQAEAQEVRAGELSDEKIRDVVERIGPIGTYLLGPEWNHGEAIRRHMERAVQYFRDHGYLRPSQAIGEPDAYMLKREDPLAPSLFTKWEVMRRIELRRNKEEEFIPLYRSPMSSEARDRAISALERTMKNGYDISDGPAFMGCWKDGVREALSALRGENPGA